MLPASIKAKDKVWLKSQKRLDRKGGKFSYKWLGPYVIGEVSKKGLCTLINQHGNELSKTYNVGLLKPYLDPVPRPYGGNTDVPSDEKPPVQVAENPDNSDPQHSQEAVPKVDSSNLRSFESAIDSNVWSKLPDEVAERILELSVRNSDKPLSTYHKLSRTCSRFNILLQRRNRYLLPRVHLNFSDSDSKKLDKYNGKIKVSVRKIVKVFGEFCGASLYISNVINEKNWKSAWLLLEAEKHSMYLIRSFYWKHFKSGVADPIINDANGDDNSDNLDNEEEFWICNELYNLKKEDADILRSDNSWLNDRIMDAAQKLICKQLGDKSSYQTVLNTQRKGATPFRPVNQEHIQLLHDGSNHWFLSFCSSG